MVRHLRLQNGIANGNRLTLIGPDELGRWPAHTRGAACQYSEHFELTPVIAGTEELFDFMGSEDVHDLPSSLASQLKRLSGPQAVSDPAG